MNGNNFNVEILFMKCERNARDANGLTHTDTYVYSKREIACSLTAY